MTKITFTLTLVVAFIMTAAAQSSNIDSVNLASKISVDSSKLVMLQHKLADKTAAKQASDLDAQQKASENASAAADLSADPDSKKLARIANRDANHAKSAAKKARLAGDEVIDVNKEIRKQQALLAKDQQKMSRYLKSSGSNANSTMPVSAVPPTDSTIKN